MRLDDISMNVDYRVERYRAANAVGHSGRSCPMTPTNGYGYLKIRWTGRSGVASNGQRALEYADGAGWTGFIPTRQIETWTTDDTHRVHRIAERETEKVRRAAAVEVMTIEIAESLGFDDDQANYWTTNIGNLASAIVDDRKTFHRVLYEKLTELTSSGWNDMIADMELDAMRQELAD